LIFSLAFLQSLVADCTRLEKYPTAKAIWHDLGGRINLAKMQICVGRQYFFEIKGGATMQSALDRKNLRILLRKHSQSDLRHELAHLYLDSVLPKLSEKMAESLAHELSQPSVCSPVF